MNLLAARRGALVVLMVLAFTVAAAWPIQETGWTQKAHYALVRSLAHGTARIDRYHLETGDKTYWRGHFYSAKAPGVAFASLPAYLVLHGLGAVPSNERTAIWLIDLLTVVPFALLLLLAARRLTALVSGEDDWLAPLVLVVATLVLPFATLYFSHVPTAALAAVAGVLGLAAYRTGSRRSAVLSGLAGGLAVVVEYPTAVVVVGFGFLLALTARRVALVAAYTAGAVVGMIPLAAYNWWAFGSPVHLSYQNVVDPNDWQSATPDVFARNHPAFGVPSLHTLAELLLSSRGLLTLTPVVLAGGAGLVLLARRGARREAGVLGGICIAGLVWNSGFTVAYGGPFGGDSPGPRYLVALLPFLLAPLPLVVKRAPAVVLVLGLASAAMMAVVTATKPQVGADETSTWASDLVHGRFTETPLTLLGAGSGWLSIVPFFLALGVAIWAGVTAGGVSWRRLSPTLCAGTAVAWALLGWLGPTVVDLHSRALGAVLGLVLVALAAAAMAVAVRRAAPAT